MISLKLNMDNIILLTLSVIVGMSLAVDDISECSSSPCQNGATCNNLINGYTCTCAEGYTGTNCQTVPEVCPNGMRGEICGTLLGLECQTGYKCLYAQTKVPIADQAGVCCKSPVTKYGQCPVLTNATGICVENCANDGDCAGDQKCCSNGCGHVCINPTGTTDCDQTMITACESIYFKPNECQLQANDYTAVSIEIKTKLSQSDCKENESYEFKNGKILVSKGCRATFTVCLKNAPVLPINTTADLMYYSPYQAHITNYQHFDLYADDIRADNFTSIVFLTKGKNDAHVLLKKDRTNFTSNIIEIVLGGWGNTKSVIRDRQQCSAKYRYHGQILSASTYRYFWVSWSDGCIKVGKGSLVSVDTKMSWCGLSHSITDISISYGYGSDGYWIFPK